MIEPRVLVRELTRSEWVADAVVHVIGIALGCAACLVLAIIAFPYSKPPEFAGLLLYVVGLMAMLSASALYNMADKHRWNDTFGRLDQAGIFVMIAGTYSPFTLVALGKTTGILLFSFVWAAAIAGAALQIFRPTRNSRLDAMLYLILGWSAVVATGPLIHAMSIAGLILVGVGGLLYSIGVIFHLNRRLRFNKAIWHTFVLAAAACHFSAVITDVVAS